MAVTSDIKTIRYGSTDGHQPLNKLVPSGTTIYRGTIAGLIGTGGSGAHQGQLKNMDSPASTDLVVGLIEFAGSGIPNTSPGIAGPANVEISTGTFILASGTGADALDQTTNLAMVYVVDSQTVGKTSATGSRPVAGVQMACNADDSSIPTGFVAVKLGTPNSPLGGP